jgi:toxin ParE1/3/4
VKVVLSRKAEIGLTAIGDYIARDNPRRAISFVKALRDKVRAIARTPLAFPLTPGFEASGIRRRTYGDYLIFYVAGADHILIVHIVHGARDYEAALSLMADVEGCP